MAYVLATASVPRNEIDIDIKVFDKEDFLRNMDMCSGDVELLFAEGKLAYEDESFAISVVA